MRPHSHVVTAASCCTVVAEKCASRMNIGTVVRVKELHHWGTGSTPRSVKGKNIFSIFTKTRQVSDGPKDLGYLFFNMLKRSYQRDSTFSSQVAPTDFFFIFAKGGQL